MMDFGPPDPRPDFTPSDVDREIRGTHHRARLYQLMQASDRWHFDRLALAFPQEAREYLAWSTSPWPAR
jgi:hypothetical protein